MAATLLALLVLVVVAIATFGLAWLVDRRNARARIIKERLAAEKKAPERAAEEELALLRDEQLSEIPALDSLLRRSARVSDLQKMLAQANISMAAFLQRTAPVAPAIFPLAPRLFPASPLAEEARATSSRCPASGQILQETILLRPVARR